MNSPYITAILAVTSLEFSAGAMGNELSQYEYRAAEKQIEAEYQSARTICDFLAPNAKGICMAEAKRTRKQSRDQNWKRVTNLPAR